MELQRCTNSSSLKDLDLYINEQRIDRKDMKRHEKVIEASKTLFFACCNFFDQSLKIEVLTSRIGQPGRGIRFNF